ncbi:MAG: LysM peptidoglycan-binding domain-containing protein [Parachlamydiaceae bacterium]|nr:LysM peptidoglycan-binding domain-containing protein [Parachlamydiaceae bacterium]
MDKNHQIRHLSRALLASGTINIIVLAIFFYWLIREAPPRPYFELKPADKNHQQVPLAAERSNEDVIRIFRTLSREQLTMRLTNMQLVDNGFTQRDLALAALVAFHHFDLNRSLAGSQPPQTRKIPFGKNRQGQPVEVLVFPGLSEQQYQQILQFTQTERWPLTAQGLYGLLRKQDDYDTSLAEAFFLSPEFTTVETLFGRSGANVDKYDLLTILCEGTWTMLHTFAEQQRSTLDLSAARRQRFLLDYIAKKSSTAAYTLLKTDGLFAAKKLDDEQMLILLNLLKDKTAETQAFARVMLTSPRGDGVRQLAATRLYEFSGEPIPEANVYHAALMRFVPQASVPLKNKVAKSEKPVVIKPIKQIADRTPPTTKAPAPPIRTNEKTYVVQDGDSLWKIAKRFKVSIEGLKKHNRLESDFLKPGTTLRIPG